MVTRLQSEKGSFVQSPLGAFDGEGEPECWTGNILTTGLGSPGSSGVIEATCTFSFLDPPSGRNFVNMALNIGQPPLPPFDVLKTMYIIGYVSGEIWSMSAPGYAPFDYLCFDAVNGKNRAKRGAPIVSGETSIFEYMFDYDDGQLLLWQNVAAFPGGPFPAFTDAEGIDLCLELPTATATVTAVEQVLPFSRYQQHPFCDWQETASGNVGYNQIDMLYGNDIRISLWRQYYHIGETSGAVWRPMDTLTKNCGPSPFGIEMWSSQDVVIPAPDQSVYEYLLNLGVNLANTEFVNSISLAVNFGEFPAAITPPFIQGESVHLQLTPP